MLNQATRRSVLAGGLSVCATALSPGLAQAAYPGRGWQRLPNAGRAIAIGGDAVWILGTARFGRGYEPYRWTGSGWEDVQGGLQQLAAGPDGECWGVNDDLAIFRRAGGSWQQLPGLAHAVAVGASGAVCCLGTNRYGMGYQPYQLRGGAWVGLPGGLVQLAVHPSGAPWGLNEAGQIFRHRGGADWQQLPGLATRVALGADGSAWILGTNRMGAGYQPYYWNGSDWSGIDGGLTEIAVDGSGGVWGVNGAGQIFRRV